MGLGRGAIHDLTGRKALPSCPPGQVSEQQALMIRDAAFLGAIGIERFVHPALVGAEHSRDEVLFVALPIKQAGGCCFCIVKAGPLDRDMVQKHARLRVLESGHGFSFHLATVGPSFVEGRRLHPQGGSLPRVVLQPLVSGTRCSGVHRDILWIMCAGAPMIEALAARVNALDPSIGPKSGRVVS